MTTADRPDDDRRRLESLILAYDDALDDGQPNSPDVEACFPSHWLRNFAEFRPHCGC